MECRWGLEALLLVLDASLLPLHTVGVQVGVEALLLVLDGALQRQCRQLPYNVCKRLLQVRPFQPEREMSPVSPLKSPIKETCR